MGGSLVPQSQKCADPRGILSRSEQRAQATQAQTERTRFKNLAVFWAEGAKIRAWWGVKNLGPQSQKCADSSGILSKSDQRAQAAQVKTERARFKNLVVFWARNAEVRAWRGVTTFGFQGRKCADSGGILSNSEQRGRSTWAKIKRARFKNLVVFWA